VAEVRSVCQHFMWFTFTFTFTLNCPEYSPRSPLGNVVRDRFSCRDSHSNALSP